MELFLFTIFCFVIYFIPAIVASGKEKASKIFWLNLTFGWTGIGWIVVLILASYSE